MEKKVNSVIKPIQILKALLASYIVTALLLLLLTFLLYKFGLDGKKVEIGILIVYLVSAFIGGMIAGKLAGTRRFLWGTLIGILYFALLLMISIGVYRTIQGGSSMLVSFALCVAGGMLGGMLS